MLRNREFLLYALIALLITTAAAACGLSLSLSAGLICLAGCLGIFGTCAVFTVRRYRKIAELAAYLQRLTAGATALDIRDNAEGELSILKNEIYKATTMLTEQAAALKKDQLELANALADISHQLKTPLTSMMIMADLLAADDLPPEKRAEFLQAVRSRLSRMEWLVLALLKLARLDADAVTLKKESIAASALIAKALAPLLIPIEIKGQSCTVSGEDSTLLCDVEWTTEALGNIIKNAVEHTPEGGSIELSYGANPLYTFITVRDNGPGIAKSDLPHLFRRFYRGHNAASDRVGIGLAMSLAILQKQNGDIEVATDKGSVFTLKFYK